MKNVLLIIVSSVTLAYHSSFVAQAAAPKGAEWLPAYSTRSQSTGRDRSMTAQVAADLRSAQRMQAKGDLTAARNSAIRAWIGANIVKSIPATSRSLYPVLLFPEGDALHFFAWNTATELAYIDVSQDSVKLAWQALMIPIDPAAGRPTPTKATAPYAFAREEDLLHEEGVRPVITKPLVFFEVEDYWFGGLLYGRVTQSGDFIALGRDALTWHNDGTPDGNNNGAIIKVNGRWVHWPKVRSIPGEQDGFAKLDQQPAGPVAVSRAAQAFAWQARQYFAKGDLTAARNAALAAWSKSNIARSVAGVGGETLAEVYLFPEGEALRFFDWNKEDRITYIEIRGDSVALVWAADLVGSDRQLPDGRIVSWPSNLMPRVPYKFDAGSRITLELGRRPQIGGALVFYFAEPATGGMPFGRVAADGRLHITGAGELKFADGHYQVSPIPDERIAAPGELPK